jgi:hypothetical protein
MNNINDKKKFWLITSIYLLVFWILPLFSFNKFFGLIEKILFFFNSVSPGIKIYFLYFIPVVIFLFYFILLRKLRINFKGILFFIFYLILPYTVISLVFYYILNHIDFIGSWI